MKDFKTYGPPAWAAEHGAIALQAIDMLVQIDDARRTDPALDIGPQVKEVAKLIDGEYLENAPYPSIFLASRTTLCLGPIGDIGTAVARNQLLDARKIIESKRFRSDPDYSAAQQMALFILYHLRIMKFARAARIVSRASTIEPSKFETHILVDTFAARKLKGGYTEEDGRLNRDAVNREHDGFRRQFNMLHGKHEADEFSLDEGAVTIKGELPSIMVESLVGEPVSRVCDHHLMNDNPAKITSICSTKDGMTFKTDARTTRQLRAFEFAPLRI